MTVVWNTLLEVSATKEKEGKNVEKTVSVKVLSRQNLFRRKMRAHRVTRSATETHTGKQEGGSTGTCCHGRDKKARLCELHQALNGPLP